MKITLNILAKDFEGTNFMNPQNCAITRAMRRAGLQNLEHAGFGFKNGGGRGVINYSSEIPLAYALDRRVLRMYAGDEPRIDFSVDIEVPDELIPESMKLSETTVENLLEEDLVISEIA